MAANNQGIFRRDCPYKKSSHKAETAGEETKEPDSQGGSAFTVGKGCSQSGRWLVDSGASSHMTWDKELLTDYREFDSPERVGLGDGRTVDALGVGNVYIRMLIRVSQRKMSVVHNVLHVPQMACNLFSVRAAASKGNLIKFGHSRCWIRDSSGKLCGMGTMVNKLYQLDCEAIQSKAATLATGQKDNDLDVWHFRAVYQDHGPQEAGNWHHTTQSSQAVLLRRMYCWKDETKILQNSGRNSF